MTHAIRTGFRLAVLAALMGASGLAAAERPWTEVPLGNAGFENWSGGKPLGWVLEPSINPAGCTVTGVVSDTTEAVEGKRALLLRGGPQTCRWLGPLQARKAVPGEVYRLRARTRGRDIDPSGQRHRNSQTFILSFDSSGRRLTYAGTPPVVGTTDWIDQSAVLVVPSGATTIKVGAFLSVPGVLLVDDLRLERLVPPTVTADTEWAARWAADLAYLGDLIDGVHPAPYAHLPRAAFRAGLDSLAVAAAHPDGPDDTALTWRLRALVCRLGDSHTATGLPPGANARLPLSLRFFGDEVRVVAAPPAAAELVGGRLVAIDGRPLAEVLAGISPQVARTHENWFREQAPGWLLFPSALYGLGLANAADGLTYTVVVDDGQKRSRRLALDMPAEENWVVAGPPESERPLYRRRGGSYWFEYLPDKRALYVKYDKAWDDPARPLAEFGRDLARELDTRQVDRFILDVRHNAGGSNQLNGLFRDLANRLAEGRLKQTFVITGRRTYSAAVYDADAMRQRCGAVVVGEPTGMAPVHPGEVASFTLPGSGLEFFCSTKLIRASSDTSAALLPDVPTEVSWADFLAGRDPALEAALGYESP